MGHASGRLFTHDHMAVTYPYVLDMTRTCREELGEQAFDILPIGTLVIAGRLYEQFEFVRVTSRDTDDTPVQCFNIDDPKVVQSHPSILAWLECWCSGAEDAIRRGYYERYPEGTRP
jgi:hypothetical protein